MRDLPRSRRVCIDDDDHRRAVDGSMRSVPGFVASPAAAAWTEIRTRSITSDTRSRAT